MEVIHNSVVSDVITGQACYDDLVVSNAGIIDNSGVRSRENCIDK
jgi:hypothetical protein